MRRGNILEGIRAGFQSYMQTRQWGSQMESNRLQQEQARLMNQLYQRRMQDYMSPEEQRQAEYGDWVKQQEYLAGRQKEEAGATRSAEYDEWLRKLDAQYADWEKRQKYLSEHPTSGGESMPKFGDITKMSEYFRDMAISEGYDKPLSIGTIIEMMQYASMGAPGLEIARRLVWREKLLDENSNWVSQLDAQYLSMVKQSIFDGFINQNKSYEKVQQDLNDIFDKLVADGVVEGGGGGPARLAGKVLQKHPGFDVRPYKSPVISGMGGFGGKE